jgi:DNA-binding Xre family transcriptional regulator
MTISKKPWSWVLAPKDLLPPTNGIGRYVRPLSVRDELLTKAIGAEVRKLCQLNNETTRSLADKLNVSQAAIAKLQNGKGNIEIRFLWDLAEALNVTPEHFTGVCTSVLEEEKAKYGAAL